MPPDDRRVILHLDMDAFYAAIEVRDNPALSGKPIIVGHRGRRGVVSTCSYEARRFGVHSAMPSVTAERLCPQGIWVPVRMERYAEVSHRIFELLRDATPMLEPLSIDEAFLDLTGVAALLEPAGPIMAGLRPVASLEDGRRVAAGLKRRIREAEGLTASVGVAPNKYLAKVASDLEKPDGLLVLSREAIAARLWPLPVTRLWGVGPKTAQHLERAGLTTIGDVARAGETRLAPLVGDRFAGHIAALAHGLDDRPVESDRESKSISEERTYGEDLRDPETIDRALLERSEGVARSLRREGLRARTVHIKVRTADFTTITRAITLDGPTDLTEMIVAAARTLYCDRVQLGGQGVRLLGVGVTGLVHADRGSVPGATGSLFADAGVERARKSAAAADAVRSRLGDGAITRARLLRSKEEN
ncbi:MAG TPA: DNA polymerase IV [Candidatus Polarisedimenticolia bacterium]|nr:DNA polymerase IV [Candidatus Polarisedimenticolia bacterium]